MERNLWTDIPYFTDIRKGEVMEPVDFIDIRKK